MARILLLEDLPELANVLVELLNEKYQATHVADLKSAKEVLATNEFDLLIFDVSLPDGSGFDLYESLVKEKSRKIPVIFLTGQSDLNDRMKGLALGAQDYILKPFYHKELMLRVDMRMQQFESQSNWLMCGSLKIDKALQRAFAVDATGQDLALNLTPNEFKILSLLAMNKGEVISRTKIVDSVWGTDFSLSDKAVNSHISNLRKKIASAKCKITAAESKGYYLKVTSD